MVPFIRVQPDALRYPFSPDGVQRRAQQGGAEAAALRIGDQSEIHELHIRQVRAVELTEPESGAALLSTGDEDIAI
jgi:hypothetical protein